MSTRPARVTARVAPRPDVRRWILIAATVATAAAALASAAGAQSAPSQIVSVEAESITSLEPTAVEATSTTPARTNTVSAVGPRLTEGLVAYKPAVTSQLEALTANEREMKRPASRNNAALIVVGLSAMVIGSIVDDDAGSIIVLGGAGVTLYGLWQYLK